MKYDSMEQLNGVVHCLEKGETVMLYNTYALEWNQVKDRVIGRLINLKRNKESVKNRLVKPIQNTELGIIYDILILEESGETMLLTVTHTALKKLNVSAETVDEAARINTPSLCPIRMQPLESILLNMGIGTESLEDEYTMWVITNENLLHGSIAVTYPGVEERLKRKLGEFYLLPSSTHEMLAVKRNLATPKELSEMICSINCTEVEEKDILDSIPYVLEHGILKPAFGWNAV